MDEARGINSEIGSRRVALVLRGAKYIAFYWQHYSQQDKEEPYERQRGRISLCFGVSDPSSVTLFNVPRRYLIFAQDFNPNGILKILPSSR